MDLELRKKKAWSEFGVSEIIGNILILMITVTLFSGIMAFVQQMPVPQQATKADFAAKVVFGTGGSNATLTVTHSGGDSIKAKDCMVLVEVDGVNFPYNMSNPIYGLKGTTTWSTGVVWTITLSSTTYSSKIAVTVVDMVKKSAIWSSQVTGGTGGNPPNILQRYADSNKDTPTADPVKEWDDFYLFVTITDPDNDLNTVNGIWIDSSSIEGSTGLNRSPSVPLGGDVYRWDFLNIRSRNLDTTQIDGHVIMIYAQDNHGHQSVSSFVMSVTVLPVQPVAIPNPPIIPPLGTGGLPLYLTWFGEDMGFGIYPEQYNGSQPLGVADTSNGTTVFYKDHNVYIRFASLSMSNILAENSLRVIDTRTNSPYVPTFNQTAGSTAAAPFFPYPSGGGAYIYECQFNTSGLPPSSYTLQIKLKNVPTTGGQQKSFQGSEMLSVLQPGSSIGGQYTPEVKLYKNNSYSVIAEWGTKAHPYEISSSDKYKMWVSVKVQDTDSTPSLSEVRITDMKGSAQLFGSPPSGSMITRMTVLNSTLYNFSIDLRLNNGVQWLSGTASYTLFISRLNDSNEGMYSLSTQIFVTGAGSRADFFAGTTGMAGGNGNFNTREYLYYMQNNNLFSTRILWLSESTPGSSTDFTATAMAAGDIDGDGDKDLLMGQAASDELYMFENTLNTFGTWQSGSTISRPTLDTGTIVWIACGDINGDGHDDFAYATSAGKIVLYNTTYGSKGWIYTPPSTKGWGTGAIMKIALKDMTGDGIADLVVLAKDATGKGQISIYDLKYSYDPAINSLFQSMGRFANSTATSNTMDFDIAYMNNDTMLDIVTADTVKAFSGGTNNQVNVNTFTTTNANFKNLETGYGAVMANGTLDPAHNSILSTNYASPNGKDGVYMTFMEYSYPAQIALGAGALKATMKTNTLANVPDQMLSIYAWIGAVSGSPQEVFYVWYSVDGSTFVPILTIDKTSGAWYNYSLPLSVMNKAIYVRFTDSLSTETSGSIQETLNVDMAVVFYNRFAGYIGMTVPGSTSYDTVRAMALDGPFGSGNNWKEVAMAKHDFTTPANSGWKVAQYNGASWAILGTGTRSGMPTMASSSFYTRFSSTYTVFTNKAPTYLDSCAPTLFDVVDINGDGLSDILVSNFTQADGKYNSYVGFWMNLWDGTNMYFRYFSVKTWAIDPPTGNAAAPWVDIYLAANLSVTT